MENRDFAKFMAVMMETREACADLGARIDQGTAPHLLVPIAKDVAMTSKLSLPSRLVLGKTGIERSDDPPIRHDPLAGNLRDQLDTAIETILSRVLGPDHSYLTDDVEMLSLLSNLAFPKLFGAFTDQSNSWGQLSRVWPLLIDNAYFFRHSPGALREFMDWCISTLKYFDPGNSVSANRAIEPMLEYCTAKQIIDVTKWLASQSDYGPWLLDNTFVPALSDAVEDDSTRQQVWQALRIKDN